MKKIKMILGTLFLFLIIACAPLQVSYDYDKKVSFSNYKTYNYASEIKMDIGELDQKRFIHQLDSVLQSNGYSKTETPSFYIDLHTKTYRSQSRNTIGVGLGSGGGNVGVGVSGGIPIGGNELNHDIKINFLDGETHSVFWQADVAARIKEKASPEKKKEHFKTIVVKALEGFSPKN